MFFARAIKPGQSVQISAEDGGEILHISQVCMSKAVDAQRTFLKINQGEESFAACVLQKDKAESCSVDLFLATSQGLSLSNDGGKNEIHVIGYFEPEGESESEDDDDHDHSMCGGLHPCLGEDDSGSDLDDEDDDDEDDDDEDDDDDDDDEGSPDGDDLVASGKIEDLDMKEAKSNGKGNAKQLALKAAMMDTDEDDEDDDDDEDEDDDDEADSTSCDSQKKQPGDKRKPEPKANANANKKAKTNSGQSQASSGAEEYKKALVDFLKKNGKTPLATLGQKIKKPNSVDMKMAAFLKSQPEVFNINNGFCSLN